MPRLTIPKGIKPRALCDLAGIKPGEVSTVAIEPIAPYTVAPRSAIRYFLIASGRDRQTVRDASMSALAAMFNEPATLAVWTRDTWRAAGEPEPKPEEAPGEDDDGEESPKPEAPKPEAPKPAPSPVSGLDALLSGIVSTIVDARLAERPAVDPAEIARIARAAVSLVTVEIKAPGEEPKRVPGVHHRLFPALLKLAAARHHVYLHGPAGSGKSTAAKACADALKLAFGSTGKVDSKYDLLGFRDAHGRVVRTPFREIWEAGGLFLFDELDRSDPSAVVALNNGLATGALDFADATVERHPDCVIIGGGNSTLRGADRLYTAAVSQDASVSDRFVFLAWGYDEGLERALAGDDSGEWVNFVQNVRRASAALKVDLVASPRASIEGAKLLRLGFKRDEVEHMALWKGLDPASIAKIRANLKA